MSEPIQKHRKTRFEIGQITLLPNGLEFIYTEREVHSGVKLPAITLPEENSPDDLIIRFRDMLGELEEQIAEEYAEWETTPAAAQMATIQALEAREAHKEAVEKTAALDAAFVANRDLNERLEKRNAYREARAEAKAAELALFEVQSAEKRAALKAVAESTQEKSNARE